MWASYTMPSDGHFFSSLIHMHTAALPCTAYIVSGASHEFLTAELAVAGFGDEASGSKGRGFR